VVAESLVDVAGAATSVLVARGLVAPASPAFEERRGRSHAVTAVRTGDHRGFVVKVGDPQRADGRDLGPEVAALRLGADPTLAELVPGLRFADQESATLVTDLVDGRPASERLLGSHGPDPEVAAALGGAVGGWHAGATRYAHQFPVAPIPWPLQFGADPTFALRDQRGPGGRVLAAVAADPLLRAMLTALGDEWLPTTVMHGDCKADNAVLVVEPDGCGSARVVLVDWEFAGAGDPAWDTGCLEAELLVAGLLSGDPRSAETAMSACLCAYGRAAGVPTPLDGFARRTALATVARLAAIAFETAEADGTSGELDQQLLELARSVAGWLATWTGRFEEWLS
jgi:hypothetical protein